MFLSLKFVYSMEHKFHISKTARYETILNISRKCRLFFYFLCRTKHINSKVLRTDTASCKLYIYIYIYIYIYCRLFKFYLNPRQVLNADVI